MLTEDWLPAYEAMPRHQFMPDAIWPGRAGGNRQSARVLRTEDPDLWWEAVHRDAPITTQWDDGRHTGPNTGRAPTCSSSMPTMVFTMLGALDVRPGDRVLEIGTGTGWNTALLCHRLGSANVVSVEVDATTARQARTRLHAAGCTPLTHLGDGAGGHPEGAAYDRVIATCSVGRVPEAWITQTRPGGVVVTPWGPTYGGEAVARLTVAGDGTASGRFVGSSAFMRLRDQRKRLPPTGAEQPGGGRRSRTALSPDDVGDWIHMFAIGVQVPDLFCRVEPGQDGAYRLWLFDTGLTSWAVAAWAGERTEFAVTQGGPRSLWGELEASWHWWDTQGGPGFERFGLSLADGNHTVWLDEPSHPVPVRA
ncbi:methyltransferase domain-containing protein [Streptomyces avicenniae]|uniref:methyltransferase domain-containing protein n=1 Tax=Streptomyces avicenniae TaxID=500153 RepID=UPI000AEF5ED6